MEPTTPVKESKVSKIGKEPKQLNPLQDSRTSTKSEDPQPGRSVSRNEQPSAKTFHEPASIPNDDRASRNEQPSAKTIQRPASIPTDDRASRHERLTHEYSPLWYCCRCSMVNNITFVPEHCIACVHRKCLTCQKVEIERKLAIIDDDDDDDEEEEPAWRQKSVIGFERNTFHQSEFANNVN